MLIIGIDPGLATTGYGVIKKVKKNGKGAFLCLDYGIIKTLPSFPQGERLKKIHKELNFLLKKYQPEILAVENIYFFKNQKTAMPVSQAKGVILFTAANRKVPVCEFTPLQVKKRITGYGRADKKEVQKETQKILKLKELPRPDDAADALAIAICCSKLFKKPSHFTA